MKVAIVLAVSIIGLALCAAYSVEKENRKNK